MKLGITHIYAFTLLNKFVGGEMTSISTDMFTSSSLHTKSFTSNHVHFRDNRYSHNFMLSSLVIFYSGYCCRELFWLFCYCFHFTNTYTQKHDDLACYRHDWVLFFLVFLFSLFFFFSRISLDIGVVGFITMIGAHFFLLFIPLNWLGILASFLFLHLLFVLQL